MSTLTAKYAIPQLTTADALAGTPTVLTNLANRLDLLLGESGSFVASPAATTTLTTPITLSRTYPGNATAGAPPGSVFVWVQTTVGGATTWNYWVTGWLGTTTTVTGFTIGMQWGTAQVSRTFNWRYLPSL